MARRLELLDPCDVRAQTLWRDLEIYDLLGGSARYQASLATGATEPAPLCVQRDRLRCAIDDRARDLKHAVSGAFA